MFSKLLASAKNGSPKEIIVVSGLPRSGTSMMMKMLAEGGLEVVSDSLRAADDDNLDGYFELEAVKQLSAGDSRWLESAGGKVVKVISALLEHLPSAYHYKVIVMERPLDEVLASQKKMLANRSETAASTDEAMRQKFSDHLAAIKYWLARREYMDVLYISYRDVLSDPAAQTKRIAEFLQLPLDEKKMQSVPSASLYRNRS